MAMALHPDRHDGCEVKGDAFKRATEAYQVLSGEIPNTYAFLVELFVLRFLNLTTNLR